MNGCYFSFCLVGPDVQCSDNGLWEGETLDSMCPVEGNPTPHIRWLRDGQLIDPSQPVRRQDAGLYLIEAEGSSNTHKEILVLVLCEFLFQPL